MKARAHRSLPFVFSLFAGPDVICAAEKESGGGGIVYGKEHAFLIEAPQGWVLDTQERGESQGLTCRTLSERFVLVRGAGGDVCQYCQQEGGRHHYCSKN